MSERANGWLLILGGLTIGLVLWLSPSRGVSSGQFGSAVRTGSDRLIYAVVAWHRANARPALRIGLICLGREAC